MSGSEKDCRYVSSRGLLKSCNIHSTNPTSDYRVIDWNVLKSAISGFVGPCPTVYICTAALPEFIRHLDELPKRIILVTGDSDVSCGDIDYKKIIECRNIAHWFAQNCNLPKNLSHHVTAMPIGLDYHTLANVKDKDRHSWGSRASPVEQDALLQAIEKPKLKTRKMACYASFHLFTKSRYGNLRRLAVENLSSKPNLVHYESNSVERVITWANQLEYAFVISPPGNGLDCHRTWEALALGCIPIVMRSGSLLDLLYESLPILLVDDYSVITEEALRNIVKDSRESDPSDQSDPSEPSEPLKLTLKYWTNRWAQIQAQEYRNQNIIGKLPPKELNDAPRCAFGICVYNNEFGLPYVLKNILELQRNKVFNIDIIAYLNDCSDMSAISLSYVPMTIVNGGPADIKTQRTVRIACARNAILEKIAKNAGTFEYFAMIDTNEYACVGDIDTDVVKRVLSLKDKWDSISFTKEAGYYDIWALSYDPFVYSFLHFNNWSELVATMRKDITEKLNYFRNNGELMPVYSAFNGFAIYKTDKFINFRYSDIINLNLFPVDSISKEERLIGSSIVKTFANDCEHRAFHLQAIHAGARIFICPESVFRKFQGVLPSYSRGSVA